MMVFLETHKQNMFFSNIMVFLKVTYGKPTHILVDNGWLISKPPIRKPTMRTRFTYSRFLNSWFS